MFSFKSRSPTSSSVSESSSTEIELANDARLPEEALHADNWASLPLFLAVHSEHSHYIHAIADSCESAKTDTSERLPLNCEFKFESNSFRGKALIRAIDDSVQSGVSPVSDYFEGKQRKSAITIQGEFVRSIAMDRVKTGQVFGSGIRQLPARMLTNVALRFLRALAPSLQLDLSDECPYSVGNLPSAAQAIDLFYLPFGEELVADSGDVEDVEIDASDEKSAEMTVGRKYASVFELPMTGYTKENLTLLDPSVFDGLSISRRKALFSKADVLRRYEFCPSLNGRRVVWRLEFYSHLVDPISYNLLLFGMKIPLAKYIPAPIQMNAIVVSEPNFTDKIHSTTDPFVARKQRDSDSDSESLEFGSFIDAASAKPYMDAAVGGGESLAVISEMQPATVSAKKCKVKMRRLSDASTATDSDSGEERSEGRHLYESECLWNFVVWHKSLVKTLHPKQYETIFPIDSSES